MMTNDYRPEFSRELVPVLPLSTWVQNQDCMVSVVELVRPLGEDWRPAAINYTPLGWDFTPAGLEKLANLINAALKDHFVGPFGTPKITVEHLATNRSLTGIAATGWPRSADPTYSDEEDDADMIGDADSNGFYNFHNGSLFANQGRLLAFPLGRRDDYHGHFLLLGLHGAQIYTTIPQEAHGIAAKLFPALYQAVPSVPKAANQSNAKFAVIIMRGGTPQLAIQRAAWTPLNPNNYEPSVLAGYQLLKKLCFDKEPPAAGRLAIIQGDPGTGKTRLLQGLICEAPARGNTMIYVSADILAQLSGPVLTGLLLDHQGGDPAVITLICEDADLLLRKRTGKSGDTGFAGLSAVLNATDGIFGAALNLRVVLTVNGDTEDIDPAALRRGRCGLHLRVNPLPRDHANKWLAGHGVTETVPQPTPLCDLYGKLPC
jgi:hypothetical protein